MYHRDRGGLRLLWLLICSDSSLYKSLFFIFIKTFDLKCFIFLLWSIQHAFMDHKVIVKTRIVKQDVSGVSCRVFPSALYLTFGNFHKMRHWMKIHLQLKWKSLSEAYKSKAKQEQNLIWLSSMDQNTRHKTSNEVMSRKYLSSVLWKNYRLLGNQ